MVSNVVAFQPKPVDPPTVRPATPVDLQTHWPFICRGLGKIKSKLTHSYWEREHVWNAIALGRASLFLIERGERVVGFLVTTIQNDPFLNVPFSLFVWLAYSEEGGVAEGHEYLESYARSQGLRYLEALTARPGLVRRMERHGWRRAMFVMRKELSDG